MTTSEHLTMELPFQVLMEAAPDAIIVVDSHGHMVVVNSRAEQLFGYHRDELIDQPVELLLPESLRELHQMHRAMYTAAPRTRPMGDGLELAARRKDGSTFPVEISLSALSTHNGMLVTCVIRDVSERKHAEARLQASEERFARVFRSSQAAILMIRPDDGCILDANDSLLNLLSYPRHEVVGRTITELHLIAAPATWLHVLEQLARQTSVRDFETTLLRSNGARREILASLDLIEDAGGSYVLAILQDITERKLAEAKLERQVEQRTAHLNALLQLSQELLTLHTLDAILQRVMAVAMSLVKDVQRGALYLYEPASSQLVLRASIGFGDLPNFNRPADFGIIGHAFTQRRPHYLNSAEEWRVLARYVFGSDSQPLLRMLQLDSPPTGMLVIPLVAHKEAVGVLVLLRTDGTGAFAPETIAILEGLANLAAITIRELRSERAAAQLSSQVAQLEAQHQAMTERLSSAESAMLQAARLAAVGQLAASVAHEINNPLYATRNCLYLLEEDLPPDLRNSEYLTMARDELTRIAGIITRMRDFYRPSRGEMQPTDINVLLEETLALASLNTRYSGIQTVFAPAPDLPEVVCNGDQLRQVFLNLILNAIDAMPTGGVLTVRTIAGSTVVVAEVQDTGVGIPADVRERLFDPFFTTKPTGTGLGLSISAHIVTQHGGQLNVESVVNQGSVFRAVLPRAPGDAALPEMLARAEDRA